MEKLKLKAHNLLLTLNIKKYNKMKQYKLFKWLASRVFNLIGGLMIGLGFPIGKPMISFTADICCLCIPGIILLGISFYYTFVETDWKD